MTTCQHTSETNLREFNINQYVWVKLTETGQQIHRKAWDDLVRRHPKIETKYQPPQEDEDGWCKFQMWSLMNEFGDYCRLAAEPPFETAIRFEEKDLTPVEASQ